MVSPHLTAALLAIYFDPDISMYELDKLTQVARRGLTEELKKFIRYVDNKVYLTEDALSLLEGQLMSYVSLYKARVFTDEVSKFRDLLLNITKRSAKVRLSDQRTRKIILMVLYLLDQEEFTSLVSSLLQK